MFLVRVAIPVKKATSISCEEHAKQNTKGVQRADNGLLCCTCCNLLLDITWIGTDRSIDNTLKQMNTLRRAAVDESAGERQTKQSSITRSIEIQTNYNRLDLTGF